MVDVSDATRSADAARLWERLAALRRRLFSGLQGGLPALAALDLTVPQSMVLFNLAERGPLSISELTSISGRSQAATSHLVTQLGRRGLTVRKADVADARRTEVHATAKALKLVQQVEGLRVSTFQTALAPVPRKLVRELDSALAAVLAAMEEDRP